MPRTTFTALINTLSLIGGSLGVASEIPQTSIEMTVPADKLEGLDAMVNLAMETFNVPGVAIGIIIDGQVVLTKGYGLRDVDNGLPVTENTLFAIGSCTKAFTTHVLGQLVDEGKLDWDDSVIKHLPAFRLKDEHATHHMTIRDLVTHQSGLPRHDLLWYSSSLSRNNLLARLQHLDSTTDLRGKFQYNNVMYVMAGLVIEKITGQTWEEAVQARVLTPLGMKRSNFSVLDSQQSDDFSLPFREKNGTLQSIPFNNITVAGPAGSINSTAADMVKWVGLQLSDGTFEGRHLVRKETLRMMHTPQVALRTFPEESSDFFAYGLGWLTGIHEGHYFVAHDGGIDGFISTTGFLPKEKIGVVVLSNSDSSLNFTGSLSQAILNQILNIKREDWLSQAQEKQKKMKATLQGKEDQNQTGSAVLIRPIDDYTGEYEHPGYGTVQVEIEDDHLLLHFNNFSMPLTHRCYDHFLGKIIGMWEMSFNCSFVTDHFGEVAELTIPLEPTLGAIAFKRKTDQRLLAVDYLKQFEGTFENGVSSLTIALNGDRLMGVMTGETEACVFTPEKPLQFSLKELPGSTARFALDAEGKITEMLFITPNGTLRFKAK